ncbi:hypothetical protein IKP13_05270, partial [bacterium]|nr:hypothetical protein [bacterium]
MIVKELDGEEKLFSENFACPYCDIYYDEIEPRTFSFNNPAGSCPQCSGLGFRTYMDVNKILVDPSQPVNKAFKDLWAFTKFTIKQVIEHYGENPKLPFNKLSPKVQNAVLYGSEDDIDFTMETTKTKFNMTKKYEGIVPSLERRWKETESEAVREELTQFLAEGVCPECGGKRLSKKALSVTIGGMNIFEMCELPVRELYEKLSDDTFFGFSDFEREVAAKPLKEIRSRLKFLNSVGLGYLTLNRRTNSLSGGEAQRIHLASQIGAALTGVTYVLDEPSIGLHPNDTDKLVNLLKNLRDIGNNVIVVEHDREIIEAADFLVDLGPGAGEKGGNLLFAGESKNILSVKNSLTADYLSGRKVIEIPETRRKPTGWITLSGVTTNNLQNVTAKIPLGVLCSVTGVSGSGKSSLIMETLIPALRKEKADFKSIKIDGKTDELIEIDQSPIGRTP